MPNQSNHKTSVVINLQKICSFSVVFTALLVGGCAIQPIDLTDKQPTSQSLKHPKKQALSPQQQKLAHLLIYDFDTKQKTEYKDSVIYQGVMTTNGNIIVPAQYDEVLLNPYSMRLGDDAVYEIIGMGGMDKEGFTADVYDLDGNPLERDIFMPSFNGLPMSPYILTFQEGVSLYDIAEVADKRLEGINDRWESRSIVEREILPEYSDLLHLRTQKRVPIAGKGFYELIQDFNSSLLQYNLLPAISSETRLVGIIDTDGNWVVQPQYKPTSIMRFMPKNLIMVVKHKNIDIPYSSCYSFLSMNNTTNPPKAEDFELVGEFYSFERFIKSDFDNRYYSHAKACGEDPYDSNYGLIDDKGEWVIKPQDGIQLISLPDAQGLITYQNTATKAVGSMNLQGQIVVPDKFYAPRHDKMSWQSEVAPTQFDQQGLMAVSDVLNSDHYGFINTQSEWVIPPTNTPKLKTNNYNSYAFDKYGLAYSRLDEPEGQLRVINMDGNDVYPALSGTISEFNDAGFAPYLSLEGKLGVINLQGDIVTEPQFDNTLYKLNDYNTISLTVENTAEQTDSKIADNKTIANKEADNEETDNKETHNKETISLVGVMDYQGQVVIPPQYQDLTLDKDYAIFETFDDEYGVIDYEQNILLPPQPHPIRPLTQGSSITFDAIYRPQGEMFSD